MTQEGGGKKSNHKANANLNNRAHPSDWTVNTDTPMTTAMMIHIPAHETALRCLPAALEQRLATSPKSPENLADALAKHAAHTEALRKAHLEAVSARACTSNLAPAPDSFRRAAIPV